MRTLHSFTLVSRRTVGNAFGAAPLAVVALLGVATALPNAIPAQDREAPGRANLEEAIPAQDLETPGQTKLEEAMEAFEGGDYWGALDLFEEVIQLLGPSGEYAYRAASAAYETGRYQKAEEYVSLALEGGDAEFRVTPDFEEASRLAGEIESTIAELQAYAFALSGPDAIRIRDPLSKAGLVQAKQAKEDDPCDRRFRHGGYTYKVAEGQCIFWFAWMDRVAYTVSVMVEERSSKDSSTWGAGFAFGLEDWGEHSRFSVRPRHYEAEERGVIAERRSSCRESGSCVRVEGGIPPSSGKGPFRVKLTVRPLSSGGTWVAGYVDGHQVGSYKVDYDLVGWVSLFVDGEAEYVFRDLDLTRLETSGPVANPTFFPASVIGAF